MTDPADAWIEVSRSALEHNLAQVRGLLKPGVLLAAVVKANAYGHGVEAARVLAQAGADMLAVTHLSEALELRQTGIESKILVFSPLLPGQIEAALDAELTLTLTSAEGARMVSERATGRMVDVHLKVDVGMGRLGVLPDEALQLAQFISNLPGLRLEGVYIHFPTAMSHDLSSTRCQLGHFQELLSALAASGRRPPLAHSANSGALLQLPQAQLEMVRVGTLLYGQYPAAFLNGRLSLRPTWKMVTRVTALKDVPEGWPIGYGSEERAKVPSRLAVIPVGYADGFAVEVAARSATNWQDRLLSAGKALRGPRVQSVSVAGGQASIVGRISMQMATVDVTHLPGVQVGDRVEVPCRRVTSNPKLPRVMVE